ncbi:hypothetical protein D3C76_835080 [compost metagenome]
MRTAWAEVGEVSSASSRSRYSLPASWLTTSTGNSPERSTRSTVVPTKMSRRMPLRCAPMTSSSAPFSLATAMIRWSGSPLSTMIFGAEPPSPVSSTSRASNSIFTWMASCSTIAAGWSSSTT